MKLDVQSCLTFLAGLGLKPQVGAYALDRYGYLAGRDEDRLADLNDAIRDQTVRAIIATRGGKGAYRIADGVDFAAIRANPKVLIGFSEITILHLAIWKQCSVPGIHGAAWSPVQSGETSSRSFETAISSTEDTLVHSHEGEPTANLTTSGKVTGTLIGGQPIKTVAAMLAFDGRIEPVQRRKMLSPCRGSMLVLSTSDQIVAQKRGTPDGPTLAMPEIVGGIDDEARLNGMGTRVQRLTRTLHTHT